MTAKERNGLIVEAGPGFRILPGARPESILGGLVRHLDRRLSANPCPEYRVALAHLRAALAALELRHQARVAQGVAGTGQPHESVMDLVAGVAP